MIVTLNGDVARKSLADLEKKYRDLEQAALDAYKSGNEALGKKLDKDIRKLKKSFEITKKETKSFEDVIKNINSSTLSDLTKVSRQLQQELKKLGPNTKEFVEKSKQLQQVNTRIGQLRHGFRGVVTEQKNAFSTKGIMAFTAAVTVAVAAVRRAAQAFSNAYRSIANFEQANANLSSILGVNKEQMKDLEDTALELGSTTRYTASEVTELQTELAKLGFTQNEIIDMQRDVLNFALAMGTDLASASNLAGVALRSFELQSTDTEDVLGTMSVACNKSALSFMFLQNSFSTIAPVAKTYGLTLKDTIALLGTLANAGFDASSAATATRNILLNLADSGGALAQALGGSVNTFEDIINAMVTLRDRGVDLNTTLELTDKRSVAAFNTFLRGAESAGTLRDAIEDVNGELQQIADVRADTVQGAVLGLQSAWEGFVLSYRNSTGVMKDLINRLTTLVRNLPKYSDSIVKITGVVLTLVVALKAWTLAEKAKNLAITVGNKLAAATSVIANSIRLAYFRVTGQTMKAAAAQQALNTAMAANPFGAVLAIVGVLAVAITKLVRGFRGTRQESEQLSDVNRRITEEYSAEASKVKALSDMVHNNTLTLEKRREALAELKKMVPDYHANLTEEGRLINDNTRALDNYLKTLEMTTRAKILEEEYAAATAEVLRKEQELQEAREKSAKALADAGGNEAEHTHSTRYNARTGASYEAVTGLTDYGRAQQDVKKITAELNEALDRQSQLMSRIGKESQETAKMQAEGIMPVTPAAAPLDDKAYKAATEALEQQQRAEQNLIKRSYLAGEISAEEYERRLYDIKATYLKKKYDLALANGKDVTAIEQQMLDQRISLDKAAYNRELKELENAQKKEENEIKQARSNRQMSEKDYETNMTAVKMTFLQRRLELIRKHGLDETAAQQAIVDAQIESQEAAMSKIEKMRADAQTVLDRLDPSSASARELQTQLAALEELHNAKLLSEKEYEEAVAQLEKEYADKNLQMKLEKQQSYIQQAQGFLNAASDFSSALQSAETAQLEAEYNRRIAAAGNNAEERERIEAEFEQKKLDTQKKYADVDMVINIAKTVAAGALAAMQAYAQLGPVAGAVMAAVIAGTTAAQVATIIAQRNAIQSATVSSSGGGTTGGSTGRRDVTGFSEGGYTPSDRSDSRAVGIVHANEWVAPAWMVRSNPGKFADLERYRRAGQHSRVRAEGFAEGGYTGRGRDAGIRIDTKYLSAAVGSAIERAMRDNPVRSYVVRNDIRELDNQDERFSKITSR